jgi:hypothetical protein
MIEVSVELQRLLPGLIILAACWAIIIAEVCRRILVERKLRNLLPKERSIRRISIFYHIDPKSIPETEKGKEFIVYQRAMAVRTLYIVTAALLTLAITGIAVN